MAIVRVWTNPDQKEWLVNTETRKVAPAENGCVWSTSGKPLCLEDFREPGHTAVEALDRDGRRWLLNLETFHAVPAIAGGDDSPVPPKTCPYHRGAQLRSFLEVHGLAAALYGALTVSYCPLVECDYITWSPYSGGMSLRDKLLLSVALQQKAQFKKLAEQLVGNGK